MNVSQCAIIVLDKLLDGQKMSRIQWQEVRIEFGKKTIQQIYE